MVVDMVVDIVVDMVWHLMMVSDSWCTVVGCRFLWENNWRVKRFFWSCICLCRLYHPTTSSAYKYSFTWSSRAKFKTGAMRKRMWVSLAIQLFSLCEQSISKPWVFVSVQLWVPSFCWAFPQYFFAFAFVFFTQWTPCNLVNALLNLVSAK